MMKKIKLKISGMTCKNCEKRIQETFEKVEGVMDVTISLRKTELNLTFDESKLSIFDIKKKLESIGYQAAPIRKKENKFFSVILNILFVLCFVFVQEKFAYMFSPTINEGSGNIMLLFVGMLTSFHCISMCGGINISQCNNNTSQNKNTKNNILPSVLYNLGRVVSYTIIGGIVGGIGSVLSLNQNVKVGIMVVAGLSMILMACRMGNLFSFLKNRKSPFSKILNIKTKIRLSFPNSPFVIGMLNGLMPCGPLQSMQIYALSTGSVLNGATSMFLFSVGTFPLMFLLGYISTLLTFKFRQNAIKFGTMLLIVLGINMIGRGASLAGFNINIFSKQNVAVSTLKDNIQVVETTMKSGEYEAIEIKVNVPVKWIIYADEESLNGCNNPIVIPEYGIEITLQPGENIIEFLPTSEGDFLYTCWMGMIKGTIYVVS